MNRETSLYLDLVRFSAALVVFVGHLSGQRFTGGLFWQAGPFMGDAVTVFFVLSGFVIGHATDGREDAPMAYAVARIARVCSVAVPALLATFVLDAVGRSARPDLYAASWGYIADGRVWQFLSGVLFINQVWFADVPQGSNLPYWSLGYEVWYYAIFGVAVFARGRFRWLGAAVLLVAVGPAVAAMFPVWLLGWLCYRQCARRPPGKRLGTLVFAAATIAWIGAEFWLRDRGQDFTLSVGNGPELPRSYLVGVLFALHVLGLRGACAWFSPLLVRCARPIRWTAGATFTLYLFHLPVAQFLATLSPWDPSSWKMRLLIFGGTLAVVFAVAEFTERRKEPWRRAVAVVLRPRAVRPNPT